MSKTDKVEQMKKNQSSSEPGFEETEAGKIWSEIKDKSIEMFALPNQKVHQYCHPRLIDPSKLYLLASATSVLPALEASVGKDYVVELSGRYIVVSRVVKSLA